MDGLSASSDTSSTSRGSHVDTPLRKTRTQPQDMQYRGKSNKRPQPAATANRDVWTTNKDIDMAKEQDEITESSPLLPPRTSEDFEPLPPLETGRSPNSSSNQWLANETAHEEERQETKSTFYLFLLTLSLSGLQIAWSVELSSGSPYLLSLGISKSLLAFVWIAGPLSGILVQPYVGMKSDRCRSRFGKRRPFMVAGAVATVVSLLVLGWGKEIVGTVWYGVFRVSGVKGGEDGVRRTSIVVAVVMIYVLDFSINVIQAGIRAFIVDNAPTHQQDWANAWASRMSGVGNIVGYLFGYVDLPKYFWFLGNTQFKALCVLASLAMLITLAISCLGIKERDPRFDGAPAKQANGVLSFVKELYRSVRKLPKQIKAVCLVQFFAWIGWFPFLFYITTYIGEIYVRPIFSAIPHMTEEEIDAVWQRATRIGTFALFMFAIMTFIACAVLPFLVAKSYTAPEVVVRTPMVESTSTPRASASPSEDFPSGTTSRPSKPFSRLRSRIPSMEIKHLTLRRAWLLSHLLFATLMFLTFLVQTTTTATILVSLVGIPWAMTNWAPFALMAAEISRRDAIRRGLITQPGSPQMQDGRRISTDEDPSDGADQAGVVLGIHNIAIAAPQVIATLVSSAIFRALQKPRGSVGDESVAWVLRFGGVAAVVAGWLTRRLGEEQNVSRSDSRP